jgi:sugar transferase (PEP-CTERM/EpsH1 system associated)
MKILFITPDIPYPLDNGARIRTFAFIKDLSTRHDVSLISFDRSPNDKPRKEVFENICTNLAILPLEKHQQRKNKRQYQLRSLLEKRPYQYISHHSSSMQDCIDQVNLGHNYDIIQVEFSQMGYYSFPTGANLILDQHNVEQEILYRTYKSGIFSIRKLYNYAEWCKFRKDEIDICSKFSMVLTTSKRDKDNLSKELPSTSFTIIPNGVDSTYFRSKNRHPEVENLILFTGTINYYPNTDGLKYFISQIYPLIKKQNKSVKFCIAGKNPPSEIQRLAQDQSIAITGYVDDMREYFEKAAIVVVPLRIGGGSRLKILEAMAMSKAVVSTSIGAEGLEVTPGENILIENTPELLAQAVVDLINNEEKRKRIAKNARNLIEEKYDWSLIIHKLEEVYKELINQ